MKHLISRLWRWKSKHVQSQTFHILWGKVVLNKSFSFVLIFSIHWMLDPCFHLSPSLRLWGRKGFRSILSISQSQRPNLSSVLLLNIIPLESSQIHLVPLIPVVSAVSEQIGAQVKYVLFSKLQANKDGLVVFHIFVIFCLSFTKHSFSFATK